MEQSAAAVDAGSERASRALVGRDCGSQRLADDREPGNRVELGPDAAGRDSSAGRAACDGRTDTAGILVGTAACDRRRALAVVLAGIQDTSRAVADAARGFPCPGDAKR